MNPRATSGRFLTSILGLPFLLATLATAAPKVATIRVSEIYNNLLSTKALNAMLEKEVRAIAENERSTTLRNSTNELIELSEKWKSLAPNGTESERQDIVQRIEIKKQEIRSLEEDYRRFEEERRKELNRLLVDGTRKGLEEISEVARRVCDEEGFDVLFDTSGNSNTGMPVLLYAKTHLDITGKVVASLAKEGELPAGTAAPATDAEASR